MKKILLLGFFLLLLIARTKLSAVTLYGGDINKTNPGSSLSNWTTGWGASGVTGWDYVGSQTSGGSGVYLGNGWVLTAFHVAPNDFQFAAGSKYAGSTYSYTGASYQIGTTDLRIFQIANAPTLPLLSLSSNPLSFGSSVVMTGMGGLGGMRWGTNNVAPHYTFSPAVGYDYFVTQYNSTNPNEAQGASGDSGGAVFYYDSFNKSWSLAGIMNLIGSTNGGATYDLTIATEISSYASAIQSYQTMAIPEPSSWILSAAGLFLLLFVRKRRRPSVHQKHF